MSPTTIQPVGQLVDDQLRAHLTGPNILAVVWRPGQVTRIHDHTTWRVFSVIQGIEHEDVFDADLNLIGHTEGTVGDINGFAPPGYIDRVQNTSDEVAITLHISGTDVTRVGSSVRRYYDLPAER